jgi:hypothetical protein
MRALARKERSKKKQKRGLNMNQRRLCEEVGGQLCKAKRALCLRVGGPEDLAPMLEYKLRGSSQRCVLHLAGLVDSDVLLLMKRLRRLKQMEYMLLLLDGYTRPKGTETYNPGDLARAYKSDPCTRVTEALLIHCFDFKKNRGLFVTVPYCYSDTGTPEFGRALGWYLEASEMFGNVQQLFQNKRLEH